MSMHQCFVLFYLKDQAFEPIMSVGKLSYIKMEERKLTVRYGCGVFKNAPPQILLQGKWLERAGFSIGDKITVSCQMGQLIITKDEPEADSETKAR